MNNLESGLLLPIRFYNSLEEQDRYKPHSIHVALTELNYPCVDCTTLAPFQISLDTENYSDSIIVYAKCADTDETIDMPFNATCWEEVVFNGNYFLSYLGTDDFSGLFGDGLYYLVVEADFGADTLTFYSDIFRVVGCSGGGIESTYFRLHTPSNADMRLIDTSDLRITQ